MLGDRQGSVAHRAVAAWVVALVVVGFFYVTDSRRMAAGEEELGRVQSEQRRFSALIAQKRKAEVLRDSLIIRAHRHPQHRRRALRVGPHLRRDQSRPADYTWLTGVEPLAAVKAPSGPPAAAAAAPADTGSAAGGVKFAIEGRTSDIQALHSLPAAAHHVALDHQHHRGSDDDGDRAEPPGDGLQPYGDLPPGRLDVRSDGPSAADAALGKPHGPF